MTHEIVFHEYTVEAKSLQEAKDKVLDDPIQEGVDHIRTDWEFPECDPFVHASCGEINEEGEIIYESELN